MEFDYTEQLSGGWYTEYKVKLVTDDGDDYIVISSVTYNGRPGHEGIGHMVESYPVGLLKRIIEVIS